MSNPDLFLDANLRRTFAVAISNDPTKLYVEAHVPMNYTGFANGIINHLSDQFDAKAPLGFIREGIHDAQNIFDNAFMECDGLTREEALTVVSDPETIRSIAEISLRRQVDIRKISLFPKQHDMFFVSEDKKFLALGNSLPDQADIPTGCPFAGKGMNVGSERRIDPLFKRFVPWAGTLATHRYFDLHEREAQAYLLFPA